MEGKLLGRRRQVPPNMSVFKGLGMMSPSDMIISYATKARMLV